MSLYPNFNSQNKSQPSDTSNILFPARVKDVILSNNNKNFKNQNGWVGIGNIQFKPLYQGVDINNNSSLFAKPLFSNLKSYPIKEEIVLIINAPSQNLNNSPNSSDYYYFPFSIALWNNINNNAMPDITNYDFNPKELNFGSTFKEKIIRSLLPEEGDLLIEGRFGNSIRFSSSTPNKNNNNNSWSSIGQSGDPILIISNNHNPEDSNPWIPYQEDINKDGSSIYMCSSQEIPINLACKNMKSFNVTISNAFSNTLSIPDSNIL